MTDGGSLSPADVMAMANNDGFGGNNSIIWFFALILLFGMGGNGFYGGGGYRPQYATQDFVQNGFNFNDLQDQNRDLMNAVTGGTAQAVAATQQAKYDNINVMKDVQMALGQQIADVKAMEQNILGNQNECCCSTKMLIAESTAGTNAQIAQSKYDLSMQLAGVEQRITAKMDANEIQNLRDQLQNVQLQQAMSGVVRYPNAWTFNAGNFPGCCNGAC